MAYRKGIVYVVEIPRWKGIRKIGRTKNHQTLESRRKALSYQHGVTVKIESAHVVSNAPKTEKGAHKELKPKQARKNRGREFFKVTKREADAVIKRQSTSKRKR